MMSKQELIASLQAQIPDFIEAHYPNHSYTITVLDRFLQSTPRWAPILQENPILDLEVKTELIVQILENERSAGQRDFCFTAQVLAALYQAPIEHLQRLTRMGLHPNQEKALETLIVKSKLLISSLLYKYMSNTEN